MRRTLAFTFLFLGFTFLTFAQDDTPVFKAEAASAFVWDEDNGPDSIRSSTRDPITGNAIHKLHHAGIEVSSRAGFERIRSGEAGEFLSFTTTITNNTQSELFVRQGIASADGHVALPVSIVITTKSLNKKDRKQVRELAKMDCFTSRFLSDEDAFFSSTSSKIFTVDPNKALTVSFVAKDPRQYAVLCSTEGCYPKGTMRFSVTVDTTDFVFVWRGRAMVDCGR